MKIKELMNATMSELNSLSEADLKSAFSNAKRSFATRKKYFDKLGVKQTIPDKFMNVVNKDDPSRTDLLNAVLSARGHFKSTISTARGAMALRNKRNSAIKTRLGKEDWSDEQAYAYGQFMKDMQERYKETWTQISWQASEIATEAITRNISPYRFMENFEYWQAHVEIAKARMALMRPSGDLLDSESFEIVGSSEYDLETDTLINTDYEEPITIGPAAPSRSAKHRSGRKAAEARRSRSRKGRRR